MQISERAATTLIIHFHKPFVNATLYLGPRYIGQTIHQKFINAQEALFRIGNNTVMFEEQIILLILYFFFHHEGKDKSKNPHDEC